MPNPRSFVLDFGIKIFIPSLAAAAGIALLLLHVFNGIFEETNSLDDTYARRSASAALSSLRENMEALILDNAYWDDAVRHAYGNSDDDWLKESWGAGDEEEVYDAAFVVDADGKTTFASTSMDPGNLQKIAIEDSAPTFSCCWRACQIPATNLQRHPASSNRPAGSALPPRR